MPKAHLAPKMDGRPPVLIQSVDRAARLLEILSDHPEGMSIRALGAEAALNVSTCHHIAHTLARHGLVHVDAFQHRYFLGPAVSDFYQKYMNGTSVVQRIRQHVEGLAQRARATAYIAIWRDGHVALVDMVHGGERSLHQMGPGYIGFDHCRASGKVLLASLDNGSFARYLAQNPLTARTAKSLGDEEGLRSEMDTVRRQGYAVDREEFEIGWYCVAAPVVNREGRTVAAMSTSFPEERRSDLDEMVRVVVHAGKVAARDLGDYL